MGQRHHEKVRSLRESKGWTQEDLATAAAVSVKTIRRAEQGASMRVETMKALASAFDVDWSELTTACAPNKSASDEQSLFEAYDGRGLLKALVGFEPVDVRADDTEHEETASHVKAVLSVEETVKRWHEMSHGDRYDAQRTLTPHIMALRARGWIVACFRHGRSAGLNLLDEKRIAREVLSDPQLLQQEIAQGTRSPEDTLRRLAEIVDGERVELLAEHARRLGCTPEDFSKAMASIRASEGQEVFGSSTEAAADSIRVSQVGFLQAVTDILRWAFRNHVFMEEHGHKEILRQK
jgi:transcriptional regulator with XRE-family HTH domain